MKAARRPWPTAVVIIVGPVTTSPAAKTWGTAVCSVAGVGLERAVAVGLETERLGVGAHAGGDDDDVARDGLLLALVVLGGEPALGVEDAGADLELGAFTRPSPVKWLTPQPSCSVMPSALASSTSKSWAGISSQHSRLAWSTGAAPRRRAVRAASMATLPPPTTRTFLPARSTVLPSLTSARKVRALWMPSSSSPGTRSCTALCVPVATSTASKPSSLSAATSSTARTGRDLDADRGDVARRRRRRRHSASGTPGCRCAACRPGAVAASKILTP